MNQSPVPHNIPRKLEYTRLCILNQVELERLLSSSSVCNYHDVNVLYTASTASSVLPLPGVHVALKEVVRLIDGQRQQHCTCLRMEWPINADAAHRELSAY